MMDQNVDGMRFRELKNLFNLQHTKSAILKAENDGRIPQAHRQESDGGRSNRVWDFKQIGRIGELYGFLKKPKQPSCITVFSTKGGILKSTLTLNLARLHALHNIKTIVIDLDPQADSSNNLGLEIDETKFFDLQEVDNALGSISGIFDLYKGTTELSKIIQDTEIPNLQFIPATSELIPLMDLLNTEVRREYWLKERVVDPLKKMGYELILIDLAPSWSIYTSNALTASDLLISPLETKIAHYRNHKLFIEHLDKFITKMQLGEQLSTIYVPVKSSSSRKLSTQIKQYYYNNVKNCSSVSIRESVIGEEAVAKRLSVIEYAHSKSIAEDIREFTIEVNTKISGVAITI